MFQNLLMFNNIQFSSVTSLSICSFYLLTTLKFTHIHECTHTHEWAPKNWYFWTVVLEKTLESSLNCKEIQPVHPEGDQSWVFIGRTDVEVETPIFWPPDAKSRLIGKDPDAGKDWGQEEKVVTEDEMVGWHHWLNGHGFGWTMGVGDGQWGLACCAEWGLKESDTTEQPNWTDECTVANTKLCKIMHNIDFKKFII